ncbi:hypothetical protein BJ165DRAFT_1483865 [Panaeolus papilionaceus]|nr:hypothetical protein BJ165DRAFT_1483865 [Panaeolus papilionaceus]
MLSRLRVKTRFSRWLESRFIFSSLAPLLRCSSFQFAGPSADTTRTAFHLNLNSVFPDQLLSLPRYRTGDDQGIATYCVRQRHIE